MNRRFLNAMWLAASGLIGISIPAVAQPVHVDVMTTIDYDSGSTTIVDYGSSVYCDACANNAKPGVQRLRFPSGGRLFCWLKRKGLIGKVNWLQHELDHFVNSLATKTA